MLTRTIKADVLSVVAGIFLLPAAPVTEAQQQAEAAPMLEEIVVRARKREETMMNVPVVTSVLSGAQIEQYAQADLQGFVERVPGMNLGNSVLGIGAQVSLRGIGTNVLNPTIDQSVVLNVDGLQMSQGLAYSAAMFDIETLQVYKGPQALFFGKAAPGGVISVETASPGDELEIITRYGYEAEAEEHRADFIISGPVTDTLGLRLAARYSDSEGWKKNKATALPATGAKAPEDENFAPNENWIVRGTAVWTPTPEFSSELKITAQSSETQGDAAMRQMTSCPDGTGPVSPFNIPFIANKDCDLDDEVRFVYHDTDAFPTLRNNGVPFQDAEQIFGTLELNYQLTPELNITSVTGLYDIDQSSQINATQTSFAAPAIGVDPDFNREDYTQELRLTSDYTDRPVNFMVGAYLQDAEMKYRNNLVGNTFYGLPVQLNVGRQTVDIETTSVFGQVIWDLTPKLELGAGVRWTDEVRELEIINEITGTPVEQPTPTPELDEQNWSPEITITYSATDDLTVFAALKQAYKSGSFDTVTISAPDEDVSFGEEEITGGDLGIKAQLLDRRMRLNATAYYYQYDDMQVGTNVTSPEGAIVIKTQNAASSIVAGAEFDLAYTPAGVPGLTLSAAANYNITEFDDFDTAPCWGGQLISEGCNLLLDPTTGLFTAQDLSDKKQLRAPEWTGHVGADYELPVGDGRMLALGWYTSFSSKYVASLGHRDDMWQDSYAIHNLSISLSGTDDRWKISLIGNNVTDEITTGSCTQANFQNGVIFGGTNTGGTTRGPAGVDEVVCSENNRRSIWIRFEARLSEFFRG